MNGQDVMLAFGGRSCRTPVVLKKLIIEKRGTNACYDNAQNPGHYTKCKRNVFLHPAYSDAIDKYPDIMPRHDIPDIAVVRIPGDALDLSKLPWRTGEPHGTAFVNAICYLSSQSFSDQGLYDSLMPPQYVYVAGYGTKGDQERRKVTPMSLTFTKRRVGHGYVFGNNNTKYSVPVQPFVAGIFYHADDSIDARGRWNGRDVAGGDSGATFYWFVKHTLSNMPAWVADTKVVAIGLVREGVREGNHVIREDDYDPQLAIGDAIIPGVGQRLADLLAFIEKVKNETETIEGDPPNFLHQFP